MSVLALCVSATAASALDVQNYWIVPTGTIVNMKSSVGGGAEQDTTHAFWQGYKWGKYIYVQGGDQMQDGDLHEMSGTDLMYTGTFRGNSQGAANSAHFHTPILWMRQTMNVGDYVETAYSSIELSPANRKYTTGLFTRTARLEIVAYYATGFTMTVRPGACFDVVIYFKFWSNKNDANSLEEYWCQRNVGTIKVIEVNGNKKSYISSVGSGYAPELQNPFYSPFSAPVAFGGYYNTVVVNGTFEAYHAVNGQNLLGLNAAYTGWSGSSGDCVVTSDGSKPPAQYLGLDESGQWKLCLRGQSGGGDSTADAAVTYDWIPVKPGASYRLSGWIYRESSSDGAYFDFNDGNGATSSGSATTFTDQHAGSNVVNQWEKVSTDITIPSWVNAVKIRCVREGANAANAYFDDVRLSLIPSNN